MKSCLERVKVGDSISYTYCPDHPDSDSKKISAIVCNVDIDNWPPDKYINYIDGTCDSINGLMFFVKNGQIRNLKILKNESMP